uniref:Odorant binding protein n=2 Tax=Heliothis virescens TaxID=7102 RepID=A0A2A4K8Q3_HELVI
MSKFTCLVLCVMAVSLGRVRSSELEKAAIRAAVFPLIADCAKEHGISLDQLKAAKAARSADGLKPCFQSCVYKKTGIFNDNGEYDINNAKAKLQKFVTNDEEYARIAAVGKTCAAVNDKPVTDGAAGCERAALLTACFMEHRAQIII